MILRVKLLQQGRKVKQIIAPLKGPNLPHETLRKIFEAEQTLNSLPCNLRVHISISEDEE